MGRKTNPNVLRIGNILHSWDSKWFAGRRGQFRVNLHDDLHIRKYLKTNLRQAAISKVEIARQPRETTLTIHTSRPAVVIGRGGSGIEKIQKDLAKILKQKDGAPIRVNVQEIRNPDTDAASVATQVIDQLERRMPYRRVLKQSISRTMQAGAKGAKISLAGRLNGAEIARVEWLSEGNVPLHTFRADISYSFMEAKTTYGTIGVKVWINRGDLLEEDEEAQEATAKAAPKKRPSRRRKSLAEKARQQRKPKSSPKKK